MICCDFCGINQYAASKIVVGSRPGTHQQVAICCRCIRVAMQVIEEEVADAHKEDSGHD
jgi:hypothetical protein